MSNQMKQVNTPDRIRQMHDNGLTLAQFEFIMQLRQEKSVPQSWVDAMNEHWQNKTLTSARADTLIHQMLRLPDNDAGKADNDGKVGYHAVNGGYVRIIRSGNGRLYGKVYRKDAYGAIQSSDLTWDQMQTFSLQSRLPVDFARKHVERPLMAAHKIRKPLYH